MIISDDLRQLGYRDAFLSAGRCGAVAWTVYAAVEALFLVIVEFGTTNRAVFTPPHPAFTLLLFPLYAAFGFLLTGCLGVVIASLAKLVRRVGTLRPETVFRAAATSTMVIAFTANLLSEVGPGVTAALALSLALVLVGLLAASSIRPERPVLGGVANSVIAALLLVGLTWLSQDLLLGAPRSRKAVVAFVYVIGVVAAGVSGVRKFGAPSNRRWVRVCGVSTIGVIGLAGFTVDQRPIDKPTPGRLLTQDEVPNIILVSLDTVRADHLAMYGGRAATPRLDSFLETATLYRHATSASDFTLASHASLFTGLYPTRHGAHSSGSVGMQPLGAQFSTLAEKLAAGGYDTAAVMANYGYFNPALGLAQGFDYYDIRSPVTFLAEPPGFYLRRVARNALATAFPENAEVRFYTAAETNERVFEVLSAKAAAGRPVFLFVNYMDAHWPYRSPEPFRSMYPGRLEGFTTRRYVKLWADVVALRARVSQEERQHLESQYDGAITYLDECLGKFFDRLRAVGIYENSLIVITSDHGEAFGDRDTLGHGNSVYQDQVHVPLLVKFPYANEPAVVDSPVSVADVFPTVLELSRQPAVHDVDGVTLRRAAVERPTPILAETHSNNALNGIHARFRRVQRALVSGSLKLVVSSRDRVPELYDLAVDPHELNNRAKSAAGLVAELDAKLEAWLKQATKVDGVPLNLDTDSLERLRSLGYIH